MKEGNKCFQIHRYLLLILISITFWLFGRQLTGLCHFLALIFQHSNTPSYIYLDIGLLKHPQHHFIFIPVALNSELHYYNHLNAPLCNHPWVASPRLVSSLSTGPGCGVSYWLCPDSSSTVSPSGWPILCILLSVHGSSWPILCIPA